MKPNAADNPVPREISALLSNERLILRETQRAVTPLGGATVFVVFLHKLEWVEKIRQHMPVRWKSPNHIDPTATFIAFLMAVLAGPNGLPMPIGYAAIAPCMPCWACPAFPSTTLSVICFGVLAWATCIASSIPWPSGRWSVSGAQPRLLPGLGFH